jgi:hypothetical protein
MRIGWLGGGGCIRHNESEYRYSFCSPRERKMGVYLLPPMKSVENYYSVTEGRQIPQRVFTLPIHI